MASGILQNGFHTNTPGVWFPFWFLGWIHKLLRPHTATESKYNEKNLPLCLSNSHDYVRGDQGVRLLSHAPPSGQTLSWWRLPGHWQFSDETLGSWATALLPILPPATGTLLCGRTAGETQNYCEFTAVLTVKRDTVSFTDHTYRVSFTARCGSSGQVSVTSEPRVSSHARRVCGSTTSCSSTQ